MDLSKKKKIIVLFESSIIFHVCGILSSPTMKFVAMLRAGDAW